MAKKVILARFPEEDTTPTRMLFKHRDQSMVTSMLVSVNNYGMELIYMQETRKMDVEFGQAPRQRLTKTTSFINAEAVRKLFGAQNYLEMIECIKERFHEETAYEDLLNYLRENKIV